MQQRFLIEFNVTESCNFRCTYCLEGDSCFGTKTISDNLDSIIQKIDDLSLDERFRERFSSIAFDFWGGEPTLCPDVIERVMSHFGKDHHYHMYTNGYTIDDMISTLLEYKDCIDIQVSYDGNPLHDMRRILPDGHTTSSKVKSNIKLLIDSGFKVSLKSTITPPDFKYMSDAWDDIYKLYKISPRMDYSPTIDYTKDYGDFSDDLRKSLIGIAHKEMSFHKEHGTFLLSWFGSTNPQRCTLSSCGMAIDTNGDLYYCHGCKYVEDEELRFGTIYDDDLVDKILDNNESFGVGEDEKCKTCTTTICITCNVVKYINSKKEDFHDRWNDYSCDDRMCKYYRTISKINISLKKVLGD